MKVQRKVDASSADKLKVSTRGRLSSGAPNPVDVHVGRRVREGRAPLGISQAKLGAMLGVSFQQIQKYESGASRIGASRLWDLSEVLNCPISFFFEGMASRVLRASPRHLSRSEREPAFIETGEESLGELVDSRESLQVLRAFRLIKSGQMRRRIRVLLKRLSSAEEQEADSGRGETSILTDTR